MTRSEFTIGELACVLKTGVRQVRALLGRPDDHNPYELVSRQEVEDLAATGGLVGWRLLELLGRDWRNNDNGGAGILSNCKTGSIGWSRDHYGMDAHKWIGSNEWRNHAKD